MREGQSAGYTIPADAFTHTNPNATVTLTATQANGQALPGWLSFNPHTGTLQGTPPTGTKGQVIAIKVTARDNDGKQANVTVNFSIGASSTPSGQGQGQGQGQPQPQGRGEGGGQTQPQTQGQTSTTTSGGSTTPAPSTGPVNTLNLSGTFDALLAPGKPRTNVPLPTTQTRIPVQSSDFLRGNQE
jgi:hypothetical protein